MTDCITPQVVFSRQKSRTLCADFQGGHLTSDAGALLLREVDRKLGLIDALDRCIPDPRNPFFIAHAQKTLLAQRIFGIALGYEDLNDHSSLRQDPLFQVVTDRGLQEDLPLASPPTLCRLENRVDRPALIRIATVLVDTFIASHRTVPEELVLDFDSTDDAVDGSQESRFFHGYYDQYCFLPLYVFCGDQLLVAYLRAANIDGAHHSRAILKVLVQRFRQVWPQVRIVFRGDSGFCRWRLLRWCDRHQVQYIVGLARNSVLESKARPWMDTAKAQYEQTRQKQRVFGEFDYGAATWDRTRRVIIKAEHLDKGANPRFVVTNRPGEACLGEDGRTGSVMDGIDPCFTGVQIIDSIIMIMEVPSVGAAGVGSRSASRFGRGDRAEPRGVEVFLLADRLAILLAAPRPVRSSPAASPAGPDDGKDSTDHSSEPCELWPAVHAAENAG